MKPYKEIKKIFKTYIESDEVFLKKRFKKKLGYELNLDAPQTLNEKIQWLKLYGMNELHRQCSDKYAVREYVSNKIGAEYLVPLLFHTQNYKQIVARNLPNTACVVKTNHDSGVPFFIKDKSRVDYVFIQKTLKSRMSKNQYLKSRERQYKNIEPRILVEQLLAGKDGSTPHEYKFICVHGKIELIYFGTGVITKENKVEQTYLDSGWSLIKGNSPVQLQPKMAEKLEVLVESLANDFLFVRVDMYVVDDKIYFGELTFTPTSGFNKEREGLFALLQLGEKLQLPKLAN